MESLEGKSKKELKALVKEARKSGFPNYINLSLSDENQLIEYLKKYESWTQKAPDREVEERELEFAQQEWAKAEEEKLRQEKLAKLARVEQELNFPLTLSAAGNKVAQYIGALDGYCANTWTKNGEMRIYLIDTSYTNSKDVGYVRVTPEGELKTNFIRSVTRELEEAIAKLKSLINISTNDLTATPKLSPEARAVRNLNAQFGAGGWNHLDLDDELEGEEYQD